MKKLALFSSLLVVTMLVLGSCSKKDSSPTPGKQSVSISMPFDVFGAAGVIGNSKFTVNLSDILEPSGNQDKVKYVSGSAITTNQNSNITFKGITGTGATLTNITFSTADNVIKNVVLNDIDGKPLSVSSDLTIDTGYDSCFNLFKQVSEYLASKKSITLNVAFTSDQNIAVTKGITLNILTEFSWN